jgi:hypothetical protein
MTNQVIALVLTVALIFGGVAVYAIYTMSPSVLTTPEQPTIPEQAITV